MEYIYKGCTAVHYECEGSGAPVIFLHGWGCDASVWSRFTPAFTDKYRAVTLDFPGFGASAEPDSVWGVEDYTRFLEAFCADLSLDCPSLVCHSFGGRVAILYASRNPVSRLVLTDSAGIKPRRSLKYYAKVYSYKAVKAFLLRVLRRPDLLERYRAGKGSSDYAAASPRMKAILSRVVNEDLRALLPLIKAPTLLFWGTLDTATPLSDALLMEKLIPDVGLVRVEGGSHFSFLEAPALYGGALASFFGL